MPAEPQFQLLPGGRFLPAATHLEPDARAERRSAVAELGDALRQAVEACVTSEVDVAGLLEAARLARELTGVLAKSRRGPAEAASVDDLQAGVQMFSAVIGVGNPVAPPVTMEILADGSVQGRCRLGPAYEGPFTYAHGGVSALLLDQMVGYAVAAAGRPGMTASLTVDYRSPVPLETDLLLAARVTGRERRKTWVAATIATEAEPEAVLVECQSLLVSLREDQAAQLFGSPG